ncbi:unnamed protein product [Caenorhabditis auriculariae]|uniref:Peptidase S1 domain-containing protein n=1 Tax=Caenorhabditis auriculariae TaxID=2777116 RepID=A0A8S1H420_9PELO|nr:unnamed protein product [Caenorhabditis auriculariae]
MIRLDFWLLLLIGIVSCRTVLKSKGRKLSEQENNDLFDNCGQFVPGHNENPMERKSLYGRMVQRGQAPWAASIRIDAGKYVSVGSGTLISPRHVLTSAHLISTSKIDCENPENNEYSTKVENISVLLNVSCSTDELCKTLNRTENLRPLTVKRVYIQRNYFDRHCFKKIPKDVAILELSEDVKFSSDMYPPCIPTEYPTKGNEATLYGFGTDPSAPIELNSGILKSINTVVQANCGDEEDTEDSFMICTKTKDSSLACSGDSGSGLIKYSPTGNDTRKAEVIGILTEGESCNNVRLRHIGDDRADRPRKIYRDVLMRVADFNEFFCDCCGICGPGVEIVEERTYVVLE